MLSQASITNRASSVSSNPQKRSPVQTSVPRTAIKDSLSGKEAAFSPSARSPAASLSGRTSVKSNMTITASAEAAPMAEGASPGSDAAAIAVISTEGCPHCKRAKLALKEAGMPYVDYNMSGNLDALAKLKEITGKTTVPQVFIAGSLVGGADDVMESLANGGLLERIAAAASTPPLPHDLQQLLSSVTPAGAKESAASAPSLPRYLPADMGATEYSKLNGLADKMHKDTKTLRRQTLRSGLFGKGNAVKGCFAASDLVEWMVAKGESSNREDAAVLAERLMQAKLMRVLKHNGALSSAAISDMPNGYLQLTADALEPPLGKTLNTHLAWDVESRPAGQIASDLRQLIVSLYDKFLSPDGRGVDYDGMSKDPLFQHYINATAELQKASLDDLSREELMAFFINIYNAIIVHGTAIYGAPSSTAERLRWFSSLKYNIGGLEFSADDIEHGILRGNKASPANLLVLIGQPQLAGGHFKAKDPRAKYAVSPMDPRIHFALVCGAKSCPPIRVYSPESLDQGLEAAATAFCEGSVSVDKAQNSVEMSMILKWYGGDFSDNMKGRLEAISKFLPAATATDLMSMLKGGSEPKVTYPPYDWGVNKK